MNTPDKSQSGIDSPGTREPSGTPAVSSSGPVVVALGGNAIGDTESPGASIELQSVSKTIAKTAKQGLVITHGNGPQVGFLNQIQSVRERQSLDVLGAETEGWLGYQIEQAIAEYLPEERESVSVLTRMEVDGHDPALQTPTKPIGRWMGAEEARRLESEFGWQFIQHGQQFRRVVPSPAPTACLQINSIRALLEFGSVVICAGGGGIPVTRNESGAHVGLEAVIDKDLASALIAEQLGASLLVLATNVNGVYEDWPPDDVATSRVDNDKDKITASSPLGRVTPEQLSELKLDAGSMGPKVDAACAFTRRTGKPAVIGHLNELQALLQLSAGTRIHDRQELDNTAMDATGALQ